MTKEQTKEAIKVMQAYCDGKQIQFKGDINNEYPWNDTEDPVWDWGEFAFRVKPEPKLRPYTFEEMCEAVKKHGVFIKVKNDNIVFALVGFDEVNIFFNDSVSEIYHEFLDNNVWLDDNSPCGIMEE